MKKLWRCNKWQQQSLQQVFPVYMALVDFSAAVEESCLFTDGNESLPCVVVQLCTFEKFNIFCHHQMGDVVS